MAFEKGKVYLYRQWRPDAVWVLLPRKQTKRGHKSFDYPQDTPEFRLLFAVLCISDCNRLELTVAEYEAIIGRRI